MYVFGNNDWRLNLSSHIDSGEYEDSMDYQLITNGWGLKCCQPLYISYRLSMLSAIVKGNEISFNYLTQTYEKSVWILLFTFILLLSIINYKLFSKKTFWYSVWTYIYLLFGKSNLRRDLNIMDLFYIISIIPFIEIIRNNLFSSLVSLPEKYANNMEDMINGYYKPYVIDSTIGKALQIESELPNMDHFFRSNVKQLNKIVTRFYAIDSLSLLRDPQKLAPLSKRLIYLKSEESMPYIKGYLDRLFNVKVGEKMYFPIYISPICFRSNFTHMYIANVL